MHTSTHLGMKKSLRSPKGKLRFNEAHFSIASTKYDFATQALSLGRDIHWKEELITLLPSTSAPVCLDLACGTGDLTFRLADRYPEGRIIGLDLTEAMIERAKIRNIHTHVEFTIKDMCETGLADNSVDIVTGAYALRNAPDIYEALAEIHRIMKPGGTAAFLDFAKPKDRIPQILNYAMLKVWGSFWGLSLHANPSIHGYISESLKTFPHRQALKQAIETQGFTHFQNRPHFMGVMDILVFEKAD
jgi:ubiquinone/menaquinone biosynthesis methyltransferase